MQKYKYEYYLQSRPGIGVEAINRYGNPDYYFYEDFEGDPGISRALPQMYRALETGGLLSVTFADNHRLFEAERKAGTKIMCWKAEIIPDKERTQSMKPRLQEFER